MTLATAEPVLERPERIRTARYGYTYAGDDPVRDTDPSGLLGWSDIADENRSLS
jgi:hypothetical protein